ncbi:hypothetical protein LINPERHAP1_LOCUS25899 [Linum perenne]
MLLENAEECAKMGVVEPAILGRRMLHMFYGTALLPKRSGKGLVRSCCGSIIGNSPFQSGWNFTSRLILVFSLELCAGSFGDLVMSGSLQVAGTDLQRWRRRHQVG